VGFGVDEIDFVEVEVIWTICPEDHAGLTRPFIPSAKSRIVQAKIENSVNRRNRYARYDLFSGLDFTCALIVDLGNHSQFSARR